MELLLTALKGLPVYNKLLATLEKNRHVGLSGAAQLGRSHLIASVIHHTNRPALILCQDEMAARRSQEELKSFLDLEIPILPSRDLGFYSASAISRQFEQKRLKLLYELSMGKCPLLISTWEALCVRTMPKSSLFACAKELRQGPL